VTVVVAVPPRLQVTSFVAFGDSITWGEDGRNPPTLLEESLSNLLRPTVRLPLAQTYPAVLERALHLRYTGQSPSVANEGKGGELVTDPMTLPRFSGVINGGGYGAVLIMEGANDLLVSGDASIEPAVISGLRQMILDAKSRGVKPLLATIPPEFDGCCPNRGKRHDMVPGFNNLVRMLATEQAVPLVDVYSALNTDPKLYIGFDGLHPNADGYAKIADAFFDAITRTLEVSTTTTAR
jgi:acyl-CoA thioesterase-1